MTDLRPFWDAGVAWAAANVNCTRDEYDAALADYNARYGGRVAGHWRQAVLLILKQRRAK